MRWMGSSLIVLPGSWNGQVVFWKRVSFLVSLNHCHCSHCHCSHCHYSQPEFEAAALPGRTPCTLASEGDAVAGAPPPPPLPPLPPPMRSLALSAARSGAESCSDAADLARSSMTVSFKSTLKTSTQC